ncbi:MAG: hypothetical protein JW994_02825 [Candidatus Omnitrophica bacterium]|nr:hypothetical protein [Candidatus Omnitrophota bacterium]
MDKNAPVKWYLKPLAVIIALFLMGPFALPLLWKSRGFGKISKIILTLVILVSTIYIVKSSVKLYNTMLEDINEIQYILSK